MVIYDSVWTTQCSAMPPYVSLSPELEQRLQSTVAARKGEASLDDLVSEALTLLFDTPQDEMSDAQPDLSHLQAEILQRLQRLDSGVDERTPIADFFMRMRAAYC